MRWNDRRAAKDEEMKALVSGGAGFIGSNIVRLLLQEGHKVVVLDNLSSGYRVNLDGLKSVDFFERDIRDADAVAKAIEGIEVIFHLAASVGNTRSIEHPLIDSDINIMGTLQILEAARRVGVRKVVFSSSAGIFGELKTLPIREDHPVEPDSPYGASKLGAEKLCLAYAKLFPLECVCLRYFNVYGLNQRYDAYGNVIPIFAHRMIRGEAVVIFGDGEQTRDFINVRDVALANYQAAMAKGVSGAFNIGSSSRITINRLVEIMSEVSGLHPEIQHGPPRSGGCTSQPGRYFCGTQAFGLQPQVQLEEGLTEYMEWMRKDMGRTM